MGDELGLGVDEEVEALQVGGAIATKFDSVFCLLAQSLNCCWS